MPERLQKIIARAGIASRRKAEVLITEGRVSVNGVVIRRLGSKADLASDTVCVDGKAVQGTRERRYLALNKPKACITSTIDPEGRLTVMDLLGPHASKGLFPVGRLDYNTEGLLILTDDGDLANHIMSAKNEVPKTYEVKVSGMPSKEAIQKLRDGIKLGGRVARPVSIRLLRFARNPWYEVTLVEGRNRQIYRMFERIGFLVEKIRRVSIGNLRLRGLEPRQVRVLRSRQIQQLLAPRPREPGPKNEPDSQPSKRAIRGRKPSTGGGRGAKRAPSRGKGRGRSPVQRVTRGTRRAGPGNRRSPSSRGSSKRNRSRANAVRRSGRPPQPRRRHRPTGGRSPARAGASGRAASRRRTPTQSRGRRSSRPGSRARP